MKNGELKEFSKEDLFLMSMIQPGSYSKSCQNEYFLTTKVNHDTCFACTCCDSHPDCSVQMTIVPFVSVDHIGYRPPGGWEPVDYGTFPVDVEKKDRYKAISNSRILRVYWT